MLGKMASEELWVAVYLLGSKVGSGYYDMIVLEAQYEIIIINELIVDCLHYYLLVFLYVSF